MLVRLAELLPADIKVCVVADRGFGDQKLYRMLTEELCFDYVIRFRGNIAVTATNGETRTAATWVRPGGRARVCSFGFGDQKLYRMLTEELCFDYVIRFGGNIAVTATNGETRTAATWVRPGGRARV